MFSLFICFAFVLLDSLILEAQGQCRNLRFTSSPIHGYRLNNHVIRTIGVINEDFCELQCYMEPNCVSYNFNKNEEANGQHKCDLNNATYEHDNEHSGDLAKNENYVYRGAENTCARKPCQNNATCQAGFTERDYQCLCIPGFIGHDCEKDINECTKGTHNCHVNAVCNNTRGSYNCTCKDGFHGDGIDCTDIDECANGTHNCDVNAVCNNTRGSYNCTCKDGFHGDGINCSDIDECAKETHSCHVNAVCNNTRGSYNCTCKDGFYGDGINCTDIDECTNGTHSCDVNAVCNNTRGSYNCTCKDGFHGDGIDCSVFLIICEGGEGHISCQNGKKISILDANYGRLDRDTCIHVAMSNINCRSSSSLQIVQDKCDGKTSCQLHVNNIVFGGDPCEGTYKYLKIKYRCQEYIGWYSSQPGRSCKHIRDSGGSRGDGEYWIDPENSGNPLNVFCDMTTDGGGWLLVSNVVIDSSSSKPHLSLETTYRGIGNCHNNKTFLEKKAMNELRTHLSFTQLRFYCSKQQGRTFHVTTVANSTGDAVVQYFSGQTDVQPDACGSFVRMDNDNSSLAGECDKWGRYDGAFYAGKWGSQKNKDRLYNHAAFVAASYHWLLFGTRWECDDFHAEVSPGDFWKVFVR